MRKEECEDCLLYTSSWSEIPANSGYMAEYTHDVILSFYSGFLTSDTYIEKLKFISKEKVIFTSNDPQGNSSDFEQDLKYLNDNDFYADIIFQKDSSLWSNRLNSGEVVQYINFINIKDHIPDFKCPEFLDVYKRQIKLTDFKTNHVTYQSENSADGFGVFSEVWYRGNRDWKAYIDGQYVDHVRANYILRAMKIPAGSHKIEFKFQPVIFATAGMLTNIGSALIALLVLVVLFFEFKKYSKSQD